jgi:hypothetical protein
MTKDNWASLFELENEQPQTQVAPSDSGVRWVAWDIEIAKEIHGPDWKSQGPLGISCAATLTSEGEDALWCSDLPPDASSDTPYPAQMGSDEVAEMIAYLYDLFCQGYFIIGYNSLSFDWNIVADEARSDHWGAQCARMAMHHIDVAFQMRTEMGYMIKLDKMAQGLGVQGKTEGMHGDLAPILWNGYSEATEQEAKDAIQALGVEPGTREAQDLCLVYVLGDVQATTNVYTTLARKGYTYWITQRGSRSRYPWEPEFINGRLKTVTECLQWPEPDTGWMTSPPKSRESYYEWTNQYVGQAVPDGS